MSIEELRQIGNKNTSQQNELTFLEMKKCANGSSAILWIDELLSRYGFNRDDGILILLSDIPDQAGTLWYGTWLSKNKEFFEFVVATTRDGNQILGVESWEESKPEVSSHKKGIGKTPAYIALELLSEFTS